MVSIFLIKIKYLVCWVIIRNCCRVMMPRGSAIFFFFCLDPLRLGQQIANCTTPTSFSLANENCKRVHLHIAHGLPALGQARLQEILIFSIEREIGYCYCILYILEASLYSKPSCQNSFFWPNEFHGVKVFPDSFDILSSAFSFDLSPFAEKEKERKKGQPKQSFISLSRQFFDG